MSISLPTAVRGRPRLDTRPVSLRMHTRLLAAIDDWRRNQPDLPGRTEAIRRLVVIALKQDGRLSNPDGTRNRVISSAARTGR